MSIWWRAAIILEAINIRRIYQYFLLSVLIPTSPAQIPARNELKASSLSLIHLIPHLMSLRVKVEVLKNRMIVKIYLLKDLKKNSLPLNRALKLLINWRIVLIISPYFTFFNVCITALGIHPWSCLQKTFFEVNSYCSVYKFINLISFSLSIQESSPYINQILI